jgi:hypothetical protein
MTTATTSDLAPLDALHPIGSSAVRWPLWLGAAVVALLAVDLALSVITPPMPDMVTFAFRV